MKPNTDEEKVYQDYETLRRMAKEEAKKII